MQITIRDVDERLRTALQNEAKKGGTSVNRAILTLLRKATGVEPHAGSASEEYHDLDDLAGTWSADEAEEFDRLLAEQRTIDEGIWASAT